MSYYPQQQYPQQPPQQGGGGQPYYGYPQQQGVFPMKQPGVPLQQQSPYYQQQPYGQGGYMQGNYGGMGQMSQQPQGYYPQMNDQGAAANQVIAKLKYAIDYYKIDLAELFCKFDRSADATLNHQEFGDLLRQIDPTVSAYDVYAVFSKFDENHRGQITFGHFCKNLGRYTEACSQIYDPNALKQQGMNADTSIQKLKMAITYYRIQLQDLFAKYDTQRNGSLNLHELGQLLRRMEPNITNYEVDLAFSKFDADRSGTITFDEFQKVLYPQVINQNLPESNPPLLPPQQQPVYQQAGYQPQQQMQGYPLQSNQQPAYSQSQQQYGYPPQQSQPAYNYPPQPQQQQQANYSYPQQAGYNYPQYR